MTIDGILSIDTDINHNIMYPLLLWGEDARNNTHNTTSDSPSVLSQHFTLIFHAT